MSSTDKIIAFDGELMLLNWGETSTRGRTVTFQLGEESEEHPFKHFTLKAGKRGGQRFMAVLVQIGEDERPVQRTPSQIAYLLCRDEMFRHFLQERSFDTIDGEEAARAYILTACGITSRSQLDSSERARAHWEAMIYQPWLKHSAAMEGNFL